MTYEKKFSELDVNKTYLTRAMAEYAVTKGALGDTHPGGFPNVAVGADSSETAPLQVVEQFENRPDDN